MDLADKRLSMGRVVSLTFRVIGRNIIRIAVLATVVTLAAEALTYAAGLALEAAFPQPFPGTGLARAKVALDLVISTVMGCITTGSITSIAITGMDGRKPGIVPAFATGLRMMLPLLGLGIVMGLGIGLAGLLLVVPGIMLGLRWAVATPARVVECTSLNDSLARSTELTAGNRWRLLGLAVAMALFVSILVFLLGMLVAAFEMTGSKLDRITTAVVGFLALLIYSSVSTAGIAACYSELRRLHDGAAPGQLAAVFA